MPKPHNSLGLLRAFQELIGLNLNAILKYISILNYQNLNKTSMGRVILFLPKYVNIMGLKIIRIFTQLYEKWMQKCRRRPPNERGSALRVHP